LAGIVVGTAVGGWYPELGVQFEVLGQVFLNALMMIVVPLILFSMIVGITNLGDIRHLGAIGWRTAVYFGTTTGISVVIGLALVNIVRPGAGISPGESHPTVRYRLTGEGRRTVQFASSPWEKVRFSEYAAKYVVVLRDQGVQGTVAAITPDSVTVTFWEPREDKEIVYLRAEDGTRLPFRRIDGQLVSSEPVLNEAGTGVDIALPVAERVRGKEGRGVGNTLRDVVTSLIPRNIVDALVRADALAIIFFALFFGAALSVLGEGGRQAIAVFSALNDAVMRMVGWIMLTAPVGIFGVVAARIGRAGGFVGFMPELLALGKYASTVLVGLFLHGVIVLPVILFVFGRRNPLQYVGGVAPALLNAFSTASSSATLPLTMEGVEKRNGISNRTASFVLPLGATVNMDGTALYEAVAAMFIAQSYGIILGPVEQVVVFLTATLAAIGAAGIPEAGLVTMVIVLKAVGLPIEGIGLILTIDWLLDRFRTTVNVWGDMVGAGIIERWETSATASK
jgi:solute carrier family 1 (high affinity glutamate transporter) protein 1